MFLRKGWIDKVINKKQKDFFKSMKNVEFNTSIRIYLPYLIELTRDETMIPVVKKILSTGFNMLRKEKIINKRLGIKTLVTGYRSGSVLLLKDVNKLVDYNIDFPNSFQVIAICKFNFLTKDFFNLMKAHFTDINITTFEKFRNSTEVMLKRVALQAENLFPKNDVLFKFMKKKIDMEFLEFSPIDKFLFDYASYFCKNYDLDIDNFNKLIVEANNYLE